MRRLPAAAAALALAALGLSACQDPAGVGLGLIDEERSNPNVVVVSLDDVALLDGETVAIGVADPSQQARNPEARVLAGSVVDPVFGDVRAVAYVDVLRPDGAVPEGTEAADVRDVWLQLDRAYAYGDTTTALPLELRAIEGQWEADTDYRADTLFAVGDVLSTTTVVVADTLRRFDLPASWVRANAGLLVGSGDAFLNGFEGFALQVPPSFAPAPGVVFGFNTFRNEGSGLRVALAEDTLFFPLSEVFSSLATAPPAPSATTLPARAQSQSGLRFSADLTALPRTAISKANLRLPIDVSVARVGPFVRPIEPFARLYGVRLDSDGEEVREALATLRRTGDEYVLDDTVPLTSVFQQYLVRPQSRDYVRYEVSPASDVVGSPATLNVLPALRPAPGTAPRFVVTLVGGGAR